MREACKRLYYMVFGMLVLCSGCSTLLNIHEETTPLVAGYNSCLHADQSEELIPALYAWLPGQENEKTIRFFVADTLRVLRGHALLYGDLAQAARFNWLMERMPEMDLLEIRSMVNDLHYGCQLAEGGNPPAWRVMDGGPDAAF